MHNHCEHHHHHHISNSEVNVKTISGLIIAFAINILLSAVEIGAGIFANSMALIGDALHNTSDALSILIAIIAYKIGTKKADEKFSYGFRRAETIGSFVNLILLFISGVYLLFEGVVKIIYPEQIDGMVIIYVSVLALIIDTFTAKLSHHDAHHNSNMKMLFIHNLADALGSIGVIVSGVFVIWLGWDFVDGIVAVLISIYMIVQAIWSFPQIVKILMNATPNEIDVDDIKNELLKIEGVEEVHHIHIWNICEGKISLECHIKSQNIGVLEKTKEILDEKFGIEHSTIQIETHCHCTNCNL